MKTYFLIGTLAILFLSTLVNLIFVLRKKREIENNINRVVFLLSSSHENEKSNLQKVADLLHDKLQGDLIAIKNFIFIYSQLTDEKDKVDLLSNIQFTLENSILNARVLSHRLAPPLLVKGDFIKAVEYYFDSIKQLTGKQFTILVMTSSFNLSQNSSYELFRVIEMFCDHVISDERADSLTLIIREGQIELIDNGNSFALNNSSELSAESVFLSLPSRLQILNAELKPQLIQNGNHFVLKILNN